ncbi:hypothetical protein [Desulforhabdus sp. TSK]|nr:hypothetical protein [Desulforhabdus sp. TSK]
MSTMMQKKFSGWQGSDERGHVFGWLYNFHAIPLATQKMMITFLLI